MRMRRKAARRGGIWLALVSLACWPLAATQTIEWKPIIHGVLKIDERPVKLWDIFITGHDKRLILLQLGARFLVINTEVLQVIELQPEALERRGHTLRWSPGKDPARETPLPTENWSQKHAGRARIIRFTLSQEGRRVEVQLPVTPDLRKFY
jgi:hypothetical protein